MKRLTKEQHDMLIQNGRHIETYGDDDVMPVTKLFSSDGNQTYLLFAVDDCDHDLAYALCDLGVGTPEIGTIRLSKVANGQTSFGLSVEFDPNWKPTMSMHEYIEKARKDGRLRE